MLVLVHSLLVSFLLVFALKLASNALAERSLVRREELSPYECGFEHHNVSRVPLSLRYFLLTLLFLLFDLEIIFLLFVPQRFLSCAFPGVTLAFIGFLLFLFASLAYEWADGTLE